jgi:hypothetical protein
VDPARWVVRYLVHGVWALVACALGLLASLTLVGAVAGLFLPSGDGQVVPASAAVLLVVIAALALSAILPAIRVSLNGLVGMNDSRSLLRGVTYTALAGVLDLMLMNMALAGS